MNKWNLTTTVQGLMNLSLRIILLDNCYGKHVIHSGYFYSASSNPLLLRGAPNTARILCRSFMPKHHRQLQAKGMPKVPERDSNPQPFGRKASNLPMSHHATVLSNLIKVLNRIEFLFAFYLFSTWAENIN